MRARPLPLIVLLAMLSGGGPAPSGATLGGTVVTVKDGKPFARDDVYVYLEEMRRPGRLQKAPGVGVKREIRQIGEDFVPHVVVVPVGAEVAFPNYDSQPHNVFSPTDPPFDLGRYSTDKHGKVHRFEDADEFDIFCDIHRSMWAKIKVVDSAFIAQVSAGKFTFSNVPPGTYKVVAWTPNSAEVKSDKIVVTDGANVQLPSALHLQVTLKNGCHDRQDGTPYDAKYGRGSLCPGQR